MASDPTQERQEAHAYLDHLPPEQLSAVRNLLESMLSPFERSLALAPPDDEPLTEEDRQRIEEGEAYFANGGKGIPMEEILEEFGLTPEDFRRR